MRALAALLILPLAACSTVLPAPRDPAQAVYELDGELIAAMRAATVYAALPTCVSGGPVICSDPATVSRIQTAARDASAAVIAAQADLTADPQSEAQAIALASQLVAQLSALVPPVTR